MHTITSRTYAAFRTGGILLTVALVGLLSAGLSSGAAIATPDKDPAPQLSIAVDNGRTSAKVGDKLTYTIAVKNLGAKAVKRLRVTQSMPTGLKFGSADKSGVSKAGQVVWRVNVKAGAKSTLRTTMTVTKTPKETLRLASVACASESAKGPPIVCAAHSDQLPAGAAEAKAAKKSAGVESTAVGAGWLVAGAVVVALLVIAAVLVVRRRRASPVHRGSTEPAG